MKIKRNLNRHIITTVRVVSGDNFFDYYRSLVQPSTGVQGVQESDTAPLTVVEEIEAYFKGNPDFNYGVNFYFNWDGKPYLVYGNQAFAEFGQDTYEKYIGLYDSAEAAASSWPYRDVMWDEIFEFQKAVDVTEMALELKLAKVIC